MDKILKLYTYVDGGIGDTPFPNEEGEPIEIGAFRYDAKRMGGAPTITASVNYPSCLDDEWTDNVYAEFNGEKYYLKQTPTSSYDNQDTMYKHDIELVSERRILDDVYFFDTVVGSPQGSDRPVSNSTKVVFFGNIWEFKDRMNASLEYSGLKYRVQVDNDSAITTEEKLMSFEDQFFTNVLQEIYNTYKVPYYFEGQTIHIGYANSDNDIPTLEYGVDNAFVSITKNNANYKIVNRATGTGSSENIPFYYPNNSPKGDIEAEESYGSQLGVKIHDYDLYANKIAIDGVLTYQAKEAEVIKVTNSFGAQIESGTSSSISKFTYQGYSTKYKFNVKSFASGNVQLTLAPILEFKKYVNDEDEEGTDATGKVTIRIFLGGNQIGKKEMVSQRHTFELDLPNGESVLEVHVNFSPDYDSVLDIFEGTLKLEWDIDTNEGWYYNNKEILLKDVGLSISNNAPYTGSTITQKLKRYIKTSRNLMPYKYRYTNGEERFYNATSGSYGGWIFSNPYVKGKPKEHIINVDDLKPTIQGTKVGNLRIDMFSEFAYDTNDNDETYEDDEGNVYFKHPYFYGKLRVMDFNLFDHAIENQPMTISFTSGPCGACNFEIGVTEGYPQKNPVQVYEEDTYVDGFLHRAGDLVRDKNGMILSGVEGTPQSVDKYQARQQDTSKYEVWIALKKEEGTYGILMPQYGKHEPSTNDTFVILGINLPHSYIINAEKKLEEEIIKYLKENNDEKFTFDVSFSRIFFEENDVCDYLNENSRIKIRYNNKEYDLYVSSFSYTMSENDVLPEIRVELDETLKVSQNALQNAISEVKSELGRALGSIDVVGAASPFFIRKDSDDVANGTVNFIRGIKFGEGGKVEVMDNNSAKLTIEYLEVTKKATFTSLEIQEKTHVGGQLLVTPAAMTCGEVEEFDNYYRCYFQTIGEDGEEVFNQFSVGDQAICQTFNTWGSKYYWRLVTGIGDDYIDLSKVEGEYDEDSDVPSVGDKIIQLGNQIDPERQNAIVIAAYGEGSPYIIQYRGIDSFEVTDDKIVTKLSSTENIFTGKVHMEMGSEGLENLNGGLNIGGQNLLRNSGFTGDYLSEPLADRTVMDATREMFSDPLDHWLDDSVGATVEALPNVAASGYGVYLEDITNEEGTTNARLSQTLYYDLIGGETYTLSFKAKGDVVKEETDEETGETTIEYNKITCNVGDYVEELPLTNEWAKYVVSVKTDNTSKVFKLSGNVVRLCDIQLERGTIATAWGVSPLDNSSDKALWQSTQYLAASIEKEAIKEGSTDILGGLILTSHIKVGDYADHEMVKETAGMNGDYTSDQSVAFWGGGDFNSAISTVTEYAKNPSFQPTEEQLKNMANFVVTHGGRVILNDAVIRGTIYASRGIFSGFVKSAITEINSVTQTNYLSESYLYSQPYIDIQKAGGYLKVTSSLSYVIGFWGTRFLTSIEQVEEVRSMVGAKCIVVNQSGDVLRITGDIKDEGGYTSLSMFDNTIAYLECKVGKDATGNEEVYWLVEVMGVKQNF